MLRQGRERASPVAHQTSEARRSSHVLGTGRSRTGGRGPRAKRREDGPGRGLFTAPTPSTAGTRLSGLGRRREVARRGGEVERDGVGRVAEGQL